MRNELTIGPFLGVVTSIDARHLGGGVASDMRNVRLEDGNLVPRYGFQTLTVAPTGLDSIRGFDFNRGWNSDVNLIEEYLSIEDRSGTIVPYSIPASSMTRTVITHSGSAVSLPAGNWHSRPYDNVAFAWALNGSAYFHNLGDNDHFRKVDTIDVANPASGSMLVSFTNVVTTNPSGDPDGSIAYTGAGSGTVSMWVNSETGSSLTKTFKSATASSMTWDLVVPVDPLDSQIEFRIDFESLTAGKPDLSGISKLRLRWTHAQGLSSLKFTGVHHFAFISSGGSALDIGGYWTHNRVDNTDSGGNLISTDSYFDLTFPPGTAASSMALLASTRYIEGQVSIYATGTASSRTNVVWHSPQTWGGAPAEIPNTNNGGKATFGFAFYKSEWQIESESLKESPEYYMDIPSQFYEEEGLDAEYFGNGIILFADNPSSTGDSDIDQIAFYFKSDDGIWRLIEVTNYSATGYTVPYSFLELLEGSPRDWQAYRPIGNIRWATPYAGSMVWLKSGSKDNVEISAVGEPKVLWNATQISEERGARLSMSPNLDDEPVWADSAGESLVMLGSRGAYASVGLKPIEMTPSKRLPGSKGLIGARAAARWKDDGGFPGIAYLSDDQELWFVAVSPGFNGDQGFVLQELSVNVRGLVRSFLTQSDTPTVSALSVSVGRDDSLWVTYEDRAMVLRRPSIIDGKRYWELYDYARAWSLFAEDPNYGLRAMSASGHIDELEFDSTEGFAPIVGANRDGGSEIGTIYWKSKKYSAVRRRVKNVRVERQTPSNELSITVVSDRQTETVIVASGKKSANFGYKTQGETLSYQINLSETDDAVYLVTIEEVSGASSRRDE